MAGATSGAETTNHSETHELIAVVSGVRVAQSLVLWF